MLARVHRLREPKGFASAVRRGRRAGSRTLVVYLEDVSEGEGLMGGAPTRVGFVVGKAVGPAVVRNRVRRRLREIVRERLSGPEGGLPGVSAVVVRALPPAATAEYADLRRDLTRSLERVLP